MLWAGNNRYFPIEQLLRNTVVTMLCDLTHPAKSLLVNVCLDAFQDLCVREYTKAVDSLDEYDYCWKVKGVLTVLNSVSSFS